MAKKQKTKVYRSKITNKAYSNRTAGTLLKDKRTPAEKKKAAIRLAAKTNVKSVIKRRTNTKSKTGKKGKTKTKQELSSQVRSKGSLNSKYERSKMSSTTNTRKGKTTFRSKYVRQDKETGDQVATRNRTNKRGTTRSTFVTGPKAFKKYSKWEKKDNRKATRQAKRNSKK